MNGVKKPEVKLHTLKHSLHLASHLIHAHSEC